MMKKYLAFLPFFLAGCSDAITPEGDRILAGESDCRVVMQWDAAATTGPEQLALFLFYADGKEPVASRFFDAGELQSGVVHFSLPAGNASQSYEIFGVANLDCRHVKARRDLYELRESRLQAYHAPDYASAVTGKGPEGGFLFTCYDRVVISDKQLRLGLERTVARLEVGVEIDPAAEATLGVPLHVDSLCVEGVTTATLLFDDPPQGESWRRGRLVQQTDDRRKGLFYLYPSAPGEPLPVVNLWCSYPDAGAAGGERRRVCYPVSLAGSITGSDDAAILPNKRYRLSVKVKGAGSSDLQVQVEVTDWSVSDQNQDF